MAIPNGYFTKQFQNASYRKSINGNTVTINIDVSDLGKALDRAQDALDSQVWEDIQKYMAFDTGALIQQTDIVNKSVRGEVYFLPPNSDYGHYIWQGEKYVDPQYKVGAFYSEEYGFWSRPGVEKIPSGIPLNYSKENNPDAQAHWDEVAFTNHYDDWVNVVKRNL